MIFRFRIVFPVLVFVLDELQDRETKSKLTNKLNEAHRIKCDMEF